MAAYTTIDDSEAYFQTKIYTGTAADLALTLDGDTDMQPNFVITKLRSTSSQHLYFDSVRGATKFYESNTTDAEATNSETLKSFDSDGMTLGNDGQLNGDGDSCVAWCWKESATAGFDIVSYTGTGSARNISHSLSAVPQLMIVKADAAEGWAVYHHKMSAAPETDYLYLNSDAALADYAGFWNDTAPTSSVFTVGDADNTNSSSNYAYISYLFSGIQGFSKFGKYTGNGNADGTFVYTGFRPAFVLTKGVAAGLNWLLMDNKRHSVTPASGATNFNVINRQLMPNLDNADDTNENIDFLSNGFKWRRDGGDSNYDGRTYVYAAFAEAPFVNSNGVPCNAR